jgi:hypothetical protein
MQLGDLKQSFAAILFTFLLTWASDTGGILEAVSGGNINWLLCSVPIKHGREQPVVLF